MRSRDLKKNWSLTSTAFHGLLDWLDEGKNSEGQNYLKMRRQLVSYFDRRNCSSPDDLADQTLNRVARRLAEEGTIVTETPAKYCYITARFILMEYFRGKDRSESSLKSVSRTQVTSTVIEDDVEERLVREAMLECLERCTENLDTLSRSIITNYYLGAERLKIENRKALALHLGISTNALSIRACRIRDKLEICIGNCVASS